jgi:hypothetical protein
MQESVRGAASAVLIEDALRPIGLRAGRRSWKSRMRFDLVKKLNRTP